MEIAFDENTEDEIWMVLGDDFGGEMPVEAVDVNNGGVSFSEILNDGSLVRVTNEDDSFLDGRGGIFVESAIVGG